MRWSGRGTFGIYQRAPWLKNREIDLAFDIDRQNRSNIAAPVAVIGRGPDISAVSECGNPNGRCKMDGSVGIVQETGKENAQTRR